MNKQMYWNNQSEGAASLSNWSNPYEQVASVTNTVNECASVLIKQKMLAERPGLAHKAGFQVPKEEVNQARAFVADLLGTLVDETTPTTEPHELFASTLPEVILDEYRERLAENTDVKKGFRHLLNTLKNTEKPVSNSDKEMLDELVLTLNDSRQELFERYSYYNSQ